MADPIQQSAAVSTMCALVTMSWGDPAWSNYDLGNEPEGGIVRYAVWQEQIVIGSETFIPMESIAIRLSPSDGGANDNGAQLTIPSTIEPAASVMSFQSLPIDVIIEEVDPADPTDSRTTLGVYTVKKSVRNPSGRSGVVQLTLDGVKSRADASLGLSAQPLCQWTLGDVSCGVDLSLYTFPIVVTTIVGQRITATFLATVPTVSGRALNAGWARFGSVFLGGLKYPIADHNGDTITLFDIAPQHWNGLTISVVAGCDKTIGTCRSPFFNEERFSGVGIALPQYNPLFNDRPGV